MSDSGDTELDAARNRAEREKYFDQPSDKCGCGGFIMWATCGIMEQQWIT